MGRRHRRPARNRTALVPARTLHRGRQDLRARRRHLGRLLGLATIARSSRSRADNKTVTSLLIKGNFPPVRRLFPETVDNYAVVNTAELIEAVRRVSLVLDREAALRFTLHDRRAHSRRIGIRAGPGIRDDRRPPHRRRHVVLAEAAVPARRSRRGALRVRADLVHQDREPEQAGSGADHAASRRRTSPAPTTSSTCCSRTCCCADTGHRGRRPAIRDAAACATQDANPRPAFRFGDFGHDRMSRDTAVGGARVA